MALLKIDWNPDARKLKTFGIGLFVFAALLCAIACLRGKIASGLWILSIGTILSFVTFLFPRAGLTIYKAWMAVAFVMGTVFSTILLAAFYFCVITPLSFIMRLAGRDALNLKRRNAGTFWSAMSMPDDPTYYERLF